MSKETLEEVAESKYGTDMDSYRGGNVYDLNADSKRAFVKGAKWMQERMYSEEEVRKLLWEYIKPQSTSEGILLDAFLEQFKKKQDE